MSRCGRRQAFRQATGRGRATRSAASSIAGTAAAGPSIDTRRVFRQRVDPLLHVRTRTVSSHGGSERNPHGTYGTRRFCRSTAPLTRSHLGSGVTRVQCERLSESLQRGGVVASSCGRLTSCHTRLRRGRSLCAHHAWLPLPCVCRKRGGDRPSAGVRTTNLVS